MNKYIIITPDGDLPVETQTKANALAAAFENEGIEVEIRPIDSVFAITQKALDEASKLIDLVLRLR